MPYRPEFNAEKFRELMLYVARRSVGDPYFGDTKLAKILCYSDFLMYGYYGQSITGATYLRYPDGPVPSELWSAEKALEENGDAIMFDAPYFEHVQKRLLAMRDARLEVFGARELVIVDQVMHDLRADNATQVSERSHTELIGWQIAGDREEIPYDTIFLSHEKVSKEDEEWVREVAREQGLLRAS